MNISGLVGQCLPEDLPHCIAQLNALPGIEVCQHDTNTGRMVIVQEARNTEEEVTLFDRMRAIAGILSLNLVYHHFSDADTDTDTGTQTLPEDQ